VALDRAARARATGWLDRTRAAAAGEPRDPAEAWLRTLVAYQWPGAPWREERDAAWRWTEEAARPAADGCAAGSLDPAGRFGPSGGRVVATALLVLARSNLQGYQSCRRAREDEPPAMAIEETTMAIGGGTACGPRVEEPSEAEAAAADPPEEAGE
jgi:hypothetical protein